MNMNAECKMPEHFKRDRTLCTISVRHEEVAREIERALNHNNSAFSHQSVK